MGARHALLVAIVWCLHHVGADALILKKAERKINLASNRVVHTLLLELENDGREPAASVTLCAPAALAAREAFFELTAAPAADGGGGGPAARLGPVSPPGAPPGVACTEWALPAALPPRGAARLAARAVYVRAARAVPAAARQAEPQRLLYDGDAVHIVSPYRAAAEGTEVDLPSGRAGALESFSPSEPPPERRGRKLAYGPFSDVGPWAAGPPLRLHYHSAAPVAVASRIERAVTVPGWWGAAAVGERYELANEGTRVAGEFSRLDDQMATLAGGAPAGGNPEGRLPAVRELGAALPRGAARVFFRDAIGNISTSAVAAAPGGAALAGLAPRYPLFGGWRASFSFGYTAPPASLGGAGGGPLGGAGALALPLAPAWRDAVADALAVEVELPPGARDVRARVEHPSAPGGAPAAEVTRRRTYLDVLGAPVVRVELARWVAEAAPSAVLHIEWRLPAAAALQRPALLALGVWLLAVAAALVARVLGGGGNGGGAARGGKVHVN